MCLIGLKEGFGEGLGEELEVVEELDVVPMQCVKHCIPDKIF